MRAQANSEVFGRESSHSQRLQRRSFVPVYSPLVTVKLKADRWSQCFERRHAEGRKGRVGDGRFCQLNLRRFARGCSPKVRAGNETLMYICTNSTWRHLEVQDSLQCQSGAQTKMSSCIPDELQDMFQSWRTP